MKKEKIKQIFEDAYIRFNNRKFRTRDFNYILEKVGDDTWHVLVRNKSRKNSKGEINWQKRIKFYPDLLAQIHKEVSEREKRIKEIVDGPHEI